jgi:hypothetical protein
MLISENYILTATHPEAQKQPNNKAIAQSVNTLSERSPWQKLC